MKLIFFLLMISLPGVCQVCSGDEFIQTTGHDNLIKGNFIIVLTDSNLVFRLDQVYTVSQYAPVYKKNRMFLHSFEKRIKRKWQFFNSAISLKFNDGSRARLVIKNGLIESIWLSEGGKRFFFWNKNPEKVAN